MLNWGESKLGRDWETNVTKTKTFSELATQLLLLEDNMRYTLRFSSFRSSQLTVVFPHLQI